MTTMKRYLLLGLAAITMTAVLSASGIWWWRVHHNPFPKNLRADATTPLFFPTKLPAGFKLNPDSFSQKHGVVIYNFNAPDGNKLNFTVQQAPDGYNFDQLYNTTMEDTKAIATPLGTAHIGNLGENTMANLVVDGTWIMAIYSQPSATNDLTNIIKSLKRY